MFSDREKAFDNNDSNKTDILFKPQLDLAIDQTKPDNDSLDVCTETLQDLARKKDKFTPLILKLLKKDAYYYKDISLAKL